VTSQPHQPVARLVKKLQACDFKIEAVDPLQHYSLVAKLQQIVFVNELGFPKEVGEKADGHDHETISAHFIARIRDMPVGTLQLINPQLGDENATMPIETFTNIKPITKGKPAMEISKFMLLSDYRRRAFCSAMMACCLSYAEQNAIVHAFATTARDSNELFERLGFNAFAKPFFNTTCQTQITPRVIDLQSGRKLLGELTGHLQKANIIP
jgi:predicted GNAT family N-acyltransferase